MRDLKLILLLMLLWVSSCSQQKQSELKWVLPMYQIGSQSSPRTADLNGDQILDIVIGAGKGEMGETDEGVLAVNGKTGELLWKQASKASMVGSANFYDITGDGIEDVFIGGRGGEFKALDGKNGELIWAYVFQYESHPELKHARFNFYNSVWVPDQNGDAVPDLLTVNGGNWDIPSGTEEGREAGVLMLFDAQNGSIIAADTMPDGRESYMSPLYVAGDNTCESFILFGTGGETLSGSLYKSTLEALMDNRLEESTKLLSSKNHGFISPPTLADLTGDGCLDIVAISHDAIVSALDGNTEKLLWEKRFEGMESSNGLTLGQFTSDEIPDIFAMMSEGIWPNYTYSQQVMLDGTSGEVKYQKSKYCFTLSTAISYDLDHDGRDEIIMSNNSYDCNHLMSMEDSVSVSIDHTLSYVDFEQNQEKEIVTDKGFKNFYSTPWLGDLDDDLYLDIVYPVYFHSGKISRFLGMELKRISSSIPLDEPPVWGGYMGSNSDGIYSPEP